MDPQKIIKFCPKCRTEMVLKLNKKFICKKCGFVHYVNPIPCNTCLIYNPQGELLLVKRKDEPEIGLWDLPGGFCELNEDFEMSVIREIEEETTLALTLDDLKYCGSKFSRYLYKNINLYTLCVMFEAKLPIGQVPAPADDAAETVFFNQENLPWDQIAFSAVAEAIREFFARQAISRSQERPDNPSPRQ